ncbi:MAG: tetratricopeptide repeat protein [Planctomycetaceae bacterium]|jgi:Tfp pilus assembly protein PilF|nr:tetratricopeptide repeat protein [Planctomycetaceae bacterium]
MRLEYRYLWKISLISVVFGIFCLLGSYCCTAVNEDLNQKAEELFSQGIQAERLDKNADAEKIYEQCLRLAKENNIARLESPVLHRLAILKAKEQKFTESEQYFREALKRDKENTALLCDFAKLYSDQKNYADAETILKNALLITPNHRRTLFNLGLIIALQNDRQTEGLRYLKLAIGEPAAFRELAKIYRQQGNNAQAEFAEQRATILEKSQTPPPANSLTSPTVTMNDQTKNELVQRIKEELLRLETAEIVANPQLASGFTPRSETTEVTTIPQPATTETEPPLTKLLPTNSASAEPLLTKPLQTKSPSTELLQTEPLQTELLQTKSLQTELPKTESLPTNPQPIKQLQKETPSDPFLAAVESQKIEEPKQNHQWTESAVESFPVKTSPNIETKSSETVKPLQTFPELPQQQVVKIIKPEPLTNESVKTFPQEVQSDPKTNHLRTLPATEFRISNSTEGDADIPKQPEVRPLTIIPLEDAAAVKNIPEYTAINVRKIPLTESEKTTPQSWSEEKNPAAATTSAPTVTAKTEKNEEKNSVSQFRPSASSNSNSAATISISLSKNKTSQNTVSDKSNSDFSARPYLEQPINLITFHSTPSQYQQPQAPVPVLNSSEKLLEENQEMSENQEDQSSRNVSVTPRRSGSENTIVQKTQETQKIQKTQNDYSVTDDHSASPQHSTKSILRPGAGKIGIQEGLDSYVYVDPNAVKDKDKDKDKDNETPKDNVTSESPDSAGKNKDTAIKSVPETNLITKSVTDSFSLMRPIPGKLANQLADSSHSPKITPEPSPETGTETTIKTETKTPETTPLIAKISKQKISPFDNSVAPNKPDIESEIEPDTANVIQAESEMDKKIGVQFSSTQAPTVLKFEIASTTKPEDSDQPDLLNDSGKPNKIVTQENVAALAKPGAVQSDSVKTDPLQKIPDNTFQPPTVLKFAPIQSEVASKLNAVQPEPIQPEPVQPQPTQPEPIQPEPVLVQKTEPLSAIPEPAIETKTSPELAITETTVPAMTTTPATPIVPITPTVPIIQTVPIIPTAPAVSEHAQSPLPSTQFNSSKLIPSTDSVAISNSKPDPVPAATAPAVTAPAVTVQEESPLPKQQPELKTEIAGNTLPQPILDHVDAFLPIQITPQPETVFIQKPTQIVTNSEMLKFVAPNRPQQKTLQNQENNVPKSIDVSASKPTIEIVQKQPEGIVFRPVKPVEVSPKTTDDIVSKPITEIVPKQTEEAVLETITEIVPKPAEEIVSKSITEIAPKPTEEIVSKPTTEIVPKLTEEIVSKSTTEIVPKPTEEIVSKSTTEIVPKQTEEIVSKPTTEIVPNPSEETVSKSTTEIVRKQESALTLIPLDAEPLQKTELERPPVQARNRTPIERPDTEEIFVLKRIERTQPRLKTELETTERLALNSISKGTLSDKPENDEELSEETEMIEEEEEEPIGFATTRKTSSIVVQRDVGGALEEFLKPRENFGKHPIFSMDSSSLRNSTSEKNVSQNQEQDEEAGFARSIKYSKKTQPDSPKNSNK